MEYDVLRPGRPQHRMVDSSPGRTDRLELRRRRIEAWPLPESNGREVRQPRAALRLVDAEPPQPAVKVGCQSGCGSAVVVEDDHADAACLPVAARVQHDPAGRPGRCPELATNRVDLADRP